MKGIIGTARIYGYGTTKQDQPYITPLQRLLKGTSPGHLALELEFNRSGNEDLARTYFLGNPDLHYVREPNVYKVYFSFGPEAKGHFTDWDPISPNATLQDPISDSEAAANFTEFKYDPEIKERLKLEPITKIVAPRFFAGRSKPGSKYSQSNISLAPTMIIHISRLQQAYGVIAADAAIKYAEAYKNWRAALVYAQDTKFSKGPHDPVTKDYESAAIRMHLRMRNSEEHLKKKMFPYESLSREAFLQKLEPFVTYGSPARDMVALPIVRDAAHCGAVGLDLEAMLEYIATVVQKVRDGTIGYYVFGNSCSQMVLNAVNVGLKASANTHITPQLRDGFTLPNYARLLGLPTSPTLALQMAAQVQEQLEKENSLLKSSTPLRFSTAKVDIEDSIDEKSQASVISFKDSKSWRRKLLGFKLLRFD